MAKEKVNRFIWGVAIICCVALLLVVKYGSVNVPRWDDWDEPGNLIIADIKGEVNGHSFFNQANESRIVFAQALQLALVKMFGWNSVMLHYFNWLALSITILLCAFALSRTLVQTSRLATGFALLAICFMGSAAHWQNLLWSVQLAVFMVLMLGVGGAIVHISDIPYWKKTAVSIVCSTIATFSFASGMMLWPLLWPGWVPLMQEPKLNTFKKEILRFETFIFTSAAVAVIGAYFSGYHHPPSSPEFSILPAGIIRSFLFCLAWFTGPFFIDKWEYGGGMMYWSSMPALILLGAAGISGAVWLIVNRKAFRRAVLTPRTYPWILLTVYALLTAVLTMMGRSMWGLGAAIANRYNSASLCFFVGVCGLIAVCVAEMKQLRKVGLLKLFGLFLTIALLWSWGGNLYEVNLDKVANYRNRLAMELAEVLPQNRYLFKLYPFDMAVVQKIAFLVKHHMLAYMPDYSWLPRALSNPKGECKGEIAFSEYMGNYHFKGVVNTPDGQNIKFIIAVGKADSGAAPMLAIPCKSSDCGSLSGSVDGCVRFADYIEKKRMPPPPWKFIAVSTIDKQCYTVVLDTTRMNDPP